MNIIKYLRIYSLFIILILFYIGLFSGLVRAECRSKTLYAERIKNVGGNNGVKLDNAENSVISDSFAIEGIKGENKTIRAKKRRHKTHAVYIPKNLKPKINLSVKITYFKRDKIFGIAGFVLKNKGVNALRFTPVLFEKSGRKYKRINFKTDLGNKNYFTIDGKNSLTGEVLFLLGNKNIAKRLYFGVFVEKHPQAKASGPSAVIYEKI